MEGNISPSPAHKEKRPFPEGFRAPASFLSRSHRRGPFFPPALLSLSRNDVPRRKPCRRRSFRRGHARVPRTFAGQRLLTPCRTHFFAPAVRHGPAAVPESAYRKKTGNGVMPRHKIAGRRSGRERKALHADKACAVFPRKKALPQSRPSSASASAVPLRPFRSGL